MGQAGSSLVDAACDGAIQDLKTALQQHKQQQHINAAAGNNKQPHDDANASLSSSWLIEVEEAMHAVVSMEIHSAQQFQQLQIALELLLQAAPTAWATSATNSVCWTGAHRACVTGNLSFLAFVFQHYDAFDAQERDAFGLFPIDLVPPELLRTSAEIARDAALEPHVGGRATPIFPATARARRNFALQILREKKKEAQARCISEFVFHEHASQQRATAKATAAADTAKDVAQHISSRKDKIDELRARPETTSDNQDDENQNENPNTDNHDKTSSNKNYTNDNSKTLVNHKTTLAKRAARGVYFIAFEPCRDHLARLSVDNDDAFSTRTPLHNNNNSNNTTPPTIPPLGSVHDRQSPLRVKFRFPRIDEFLHGYFQLIWRADATDACCEEPHYGPHVLVRDEVLLDPHCVDLLASDSCEHALNVQEAAALEGPHNEAQPQQQQQQSDVRRLDDTNPVLQGCFPFDVSHLPNDAVCHVLFVACDKHLMRRTVVLSTEAIALRSSSSSNAKENRNDLHINSESSDSDTTSNNNESDSDEEKLEDEEEDQDKQTRTGVLFHVAGEAFRHPNVAFAGQSFTGLEDFEAFVKALKQQQQQGEEEATSATTNGLDDDGDAGKTDAGNKQRASEAQATERSIEDGDPTAPCSKRQTQQQQQNDKNDGDGSTLQHDKHEHYDDASNAIDARSGMEALDEQDDVV